MKWAIFIVLCCILNTQTIHSQINENQSIINHIEPNIEIYNYELIFPFLLNIDLTDKLNINFNYDNIIDLIGVLLLMISTFLIVITPLILLFFWSYYSIVYVKKFRSIFSLKKWLTKKSQLNKKYFQKHIWWPYRKVYSSMLGFGMAIMAYLFFSIRFLLYNFDKMEIALAEYFSFPFKVLANLNWMETNQITTIHLDELWDEMFLIVIMSFVFFMLGFLMGSLIVDFRFKSMDKEIQDLAIKTKLEKEMFYIKLDKKIHAEERMKVEQVS